MRKKLFLLLLGMACLTVQAQTDVTKYYLTNYGFDSSFDYTASSSEAVAQEILPIDDWTSEISVDYTIAGIYEFGFRGTFNNATVPTRGYDGEAGGGLAISTGWDQSFRFSQTVTLPAGTYTIKAPAYNGKDVTAGSSLLAWIPSSGTAVTSTVSSYAAKSWTSDQITFTLNATTTGKIQIGFKAASGASANSAAIVIDYVQLLGQNMAVSKTELKTAIDAANSAYGSGTGTGASTLRTAITQAQNVYNKSAATMPEVLEATYTLNQALETYRKQNASASNPIDYTSYIVNPSFESEASNGWTVRSMQRQNNNVFSIKAGSYYLESWVSIGQQLGNFGVSQTVKKLPQGNYRLSVAALHIQQSGSNSTTNQGSAQTGAYLFAGTTRQAITSMNTYTLTFSVLDEESNIDIGMVAENATGNYLCVDNFKLEYIGPISADSYKSELRNLLEQAQELLDKGLQTAVATSLQQAMTTAQSALNSSNTSTLASAHASLQAAIDAAKTSRLLYDELETRLAYAKKVLGWWEGESYRATAWSQLQSAIATATAQSTNYTLTNAQLQTSISTLDSSISAVDKKIYCSGNACGSDAELQNNNSYWSYERSLQSKHWILFWEKGYGTTPPSAVPGILEKADQLFEFYANDLGYLTINQGKSKTDTYKMIIRLRYSTDWEAAGSGIDNQIGLLTLSNGAHTSRSGQTVAHEIGHCFQYQTHCDNGDWNGWMYNWGQSTLNVFWEMCAQWQAYKFYPTMQFVWDSGQGNDWFGGTINGLHRHPLCVDLRYNNYFIQDYMCHKHGMKFLGRMWNESKSPEDPLQAYMRLTMTGTTAQKLSQLGDEMWEYGARMTTFDLDPIRSYGAWRIGFRNQTNLTKDAEEYWWPTKGDCIENWGNNAIRLNAPTTAKTIYVEFEGEAGASGYNSYNTENAGWRIGFVAYKSDGTRYYSEIASANYANPKKTVSFNCPAGCQYVWLVVSGAPTNYWTRDWLSWSEESTVEQWPYRVKLHKTNVYGQPNNDTDPEDYEEDPGENNPAYGQTVFDVTNAMAPWLSTASLGEWTNSGFKLGPDGASYVGAGQAMVSTPFIENWSAGALADASVQQTVRELPNGTYYIGGSFIATVQSDASAEVSGVEFFAGNQTVSVATANNVPKTYSLRVDVTDGTLTYGFRTRSATANWVAMDNLFLYWAGEAADYYANATATKPVRVPLANPRMEDGSDNNFNGWTLTYTSHNWGSDDSRQYWTGFDGPAMGSWRSIAEGAGLTNMSALQNVALPAGNFQLQATVLASTNPQSGVTLVLGPSSANCSTPSETTVTFSTPLTKLDEGTYTLGLKVENTTANWVLWDNAVLYLYGENIADVYWQALQAAKDAQQANEPDNNGAAAAAVSQYEWTAEELATKSDDAVRAAIAVLNNGAAISNSSQNATGLVANADFSGAVESLGVQGSGGRVEYPVDWTFERSYEGWNDTFVDTQNGIFNAWAGVISQAELFQVISSLPNGTYKLTADVRVDNPSETSQTALYGKGETTVTGPTAGTEIAGGDTFATYSLTFDVTDNTATIGILSNYSFYQIKNLKLEFVPATTVLIGDINRDGLIDTADVKALAGILLGTVTDRVAYDFDAADVNQDGNRSIADLTALVNIILSR